MSRKRSRKGPIGPPRSTAGVGVARNAAVASGRCWNACARGIARAAPDPDRGVPGQGRTKGNCRPGPARWPVPAGEHIMDVELVVVAAFAAAWILAVGLLFRLIR
ncbi:protein of unknown function [Rhodovastum atsumiense]|nr:protein of unknown function [Rhodovastum atsumiense]